MKKIFQVDYDPWTIGYLLAAERKRLNIPADKLAEKAGIHVNTIWRIERGEGIPRIEVLQEWCKALGYSEIKIKVK